MTLGGSGHSPAGVSLAHCRILARPRTLRTRTRPSPHPCPSSPATAGSTRSTGASCRLSIRFRRAKGRCEGCGRPHGREVLHLGDGLWWDEDAGTWRCGQGQAAPTPADRRTPPSCRCTGRGCSCRRAISTTTRRTTRPGNLAALCQRCHLLHDAPEHRRRRAVTVRARRAMRRPVRRAISDCMTPL